MTLCCQMSCAVLGGSGRRLRSSFSFFSDSAFRTVSRRLYFSYITTRSLEIHTYQHDLAPVIHSTGLTFLLQYIIWHCIDRLPSSYLAARSTCGPRVSWARCQRGPGAPAAVWDASPQRRWTWLKLAFWVSLDWPTNYRTREYHKRIQQRQSKQLNAPKKMTLNFYFLITQIIKHVEL